MHTAAAESRSPRDHAPGERTLTGRPRNAEVALHSSRHPHSLQDTVLQNASQKKIDASKLILTQNLSPSLAYVSMPNPSKEQRRAVFNALAQNGLGFIERSAVELPKDQQVSIAHFATGVELVLKARLFAEHWTLIAERPHQCNWAAVESGTVKSIQASDLCAALSTITGDSLHHEQPVFRRVFEHRNRVLHWLPHDDVVAVTAEQCRAWHALYSLLLGSWAPVFAEQRGQIDKVEKTLRTHKVYLETRFKAIEPKLRGLSNAGRVALCRVCEFPSAEVLNPDSLVSPSDCQVCDSVGIIARFRCGALKEIADLPFECDRCHSEHTQKELANDVESTNCRSNDELLNEPGRPQCGECLELESKVIPFEDGYVCLDCHAQFDTGDYETCEYCNQPWVGYNTESSYWLGCELCEGCAEKD